MYVCNMYVCEHGVPQNIIIIIITIIIIMIMIMIIIVIVIVIVIIISRSSFFKYGTWWSTTGFFGTPFSNKLYLYGRMCVVCIYAYCRFHRYQDMQASNMCTFHCLIISHLTLQLLGTNNYVFFQGAVSQFPELFPMESKTCGIVRNTSNCCAWGQSLLE